MQHQVVGVPSSNGASRAYRGALLALTEAQVPFLVGGAFSLHQFTGIARDTKDLDLFLPVEDCDRALAALERAGYRTEVTYPHWLAKAYHGEHFIDLIFNSGNGVCPVDLSWFERAPRVELFGVDVLICPAEEMIWTKAFVMERERYDGADVAHLLLACGDGLNWQLLLERFGPHWRVLYAHIILFQFVYPAQADQVPAWVMQQLAERLADEVVQGPQRTSVCRGTLISREQYLPDLSSGLKDARVRPHGPLTSDELAPWTASIHEQKKH